MGLYVVIWWSHICIYSGPRMVLLFASSRIGVMVGFIGVIGRFIGVLVGFIGGFREG